MAGRLSLGGSGRLSSGDSGFPASFKRFQCLQCGKCCTLTVEPTEQDIDKIERMGYKRDRFLKDGKLRKLNGACCFLKREGSKYFCSIHEIKPRVCRKYPFTVMSRDKLFSCPGLRVEK